MVLSIPQDDGEVVVVQEDDKGQEGERVEPEGTKEVGEREEAGEEEMQE